MMPAEPWRTSTKTERKEPRERAPNSAPEGSCPCSKGGIRYGGGWTNREQCRETVQDGEAPSLERRHLRLQRIAGYFFMWCFQRISAVKIKGDAQFSDGAHRMKWIAGPLLAGALVAWPAFGSDADSWDLVKQERIFVIYETKVPGSDVVAFKGRGVINQPVVKVASVLLDGKHAREWVGHLEESHTIRRISPMEYIQYNHLGTPFVMKDRDFVVRITIDVLPEKRRARALQVDGRPPGSSHQLRARGNHRQRFHAHLAGAEDQDVA